MRNRRRQRMGAPPPFAGAFGLACSTYLKSFGYLNSVSHHFTRSFHIFTTCSIFSPAVFFSATFWLSICLMYAA